MKDENIKEILDNLKDIDKTSILKNNDAKIILNYITNLQKENKKYDQCLTELTDNYKDLQKELTNLQQENQDIKDTLQDKLDYIGHLKELCDKYEEEHNTKFNEWVFDKRENERLTQGVTLLTNKLIDMKKERNMFKNSFETMSKNYFEEKSRNEKAIKHIKEYCIDDEFYINLTNKEKNIIDVLNILQDGE